MFKPLLLSTFLTIYSVFYGQVEKKFNKENLKYGFNLNADFGKNILLQNSDRLNSIFNNVNNSGIQLSIRPIFSRLSFSSEFNVFYKYNKSLSFETGVSFSNFRIRETFFLRSTFVSGVEYTNYNYLGIPIILNIKLNESIKKWNFIGLKLTNSYLLSSKYVTFSGNKINKEEINLPFTIWSVISYGYFFKLKNNKLLKLETSFGFGIIPTTYSKVILNGSHLSEHLRKFSIGLGYYFGK